MMRNDSLVSKVSYPVFDEMWFLTIDPFIGISVSSQSFPSDNTADVFSRVFIVKNM